MKTWSYTIVNSDAECPDLVDHLPATAWQDLEKAKHEAWVSMCGVFDGPEPEGEWSYEDKEHEGKLYVPREADALWRRMRSNADYAPKGAWTWDVYGYQTFIVVVYPIEVQS